MPLHPSKAAQTAALRRAGAAPLVARTRRAGENAPTLRLLLAGTKMLRPTCCSLREAFLTRGRWRLPVQRSCSTVERGAPASSAA